MVISIRNLLTQLAVVCLGGATYNTQSTSWYTLVSVGLLLYVARDLWVDRKP
mgnify:FL=1